MNWQGLVEKTVPGGKHTQGIVKQFFGKDNVNFVISWEPMKYKDESS